MFKTLLLALSPFIFCPIIFESSSQEESSEKSLVQVVFIDITASVKTNEAILAKNVKVFNNIIRTATEQEGNKVIFKYIYTNTASIMAHEFVYIPPKLKHKKRSSSDQKMAELRHRKKVRRYKSLFTEQLQTVYFSKTEEFHQTNVMGSFKVLERVCEENPKSRITAVYFSDMKESSSFANLYKKGGVKFKSYQEARERGITDLKRLYTKYDLKPGVLKRVNNVLVVFPAGATDLDNAYDMLPEFYKEIMYGLGIKKIKFI